MHTLNRAFCWFVRVFQKHPARDDDIRELSPMAVEYARKMCEKV